MIWPTGKIPTDNPECGFDNELCEWLNSGIALLYSKFYTSTSKIIDEGLNDCVLIDSILFFADVEIYLVSLLVVMPLFGVLAVILITFLTLQKTRLQTKLEDSNWWLIDYSDITILMEPKVGHKVYAKLKTQTDLIFT